MGVEQETLLPVREIVSVLYEEADGLGRLALEKGGDLPLSLVGVVSLIEEALEQRAHDREASA